MALNRVRKKTDSDEYPPQQKRESRRGEESRRSLERSASERRRHMVEVTGDPEQGFELRSTAWDSSGERISFNQDPSFF